ncbi:MAG: hypothetical protein ACLT8V_02565 [Streptococcus salivarius]
MTCKAGVEKRYNNGLTGIATVAEEDVQVVESNWINDSGQFAKNVQTSFKKAGKFKSI